MSNPRTDLAAIARLTDDIRVTWPRFEQTIATLGLSAAATTLGIGAHGGDIPDPVYAASLPTEWDEVCAELTEARSHLDHILSVVQRIARDEPAAARHHESAVRGARCSELNCDELAVHRDGLCWRHWTDARDQAQRRYA